jgi:hypothetical protein
VRPGLVAVGIALVVVGVLVGYVGLSTPGSPISKGLSREFSVPEVLPAHQRIDIVTVVNSTSANFVLSWTSTAPLNVTLFQGVACSSASGFCTSGPPLASWPSNTSGGWLHSGTVVNPYLLDVDNHQSSNVSLAGSLAESYPDGTGPAPTSTVVTLLAGGVLLVVIGGLALFLGLFLRSGVYAEPEPLVPRYAHELDRSGVDPLDEPFEEEPDSDEEPPGYPPAH